MKQIHIHLGVHKTATTYLQTVLKNNKLNLTEKKIEYFTLEEVRWPLKFLKRKTNKDAPRLAEKIGKELAGNKLVLFSEENLIGVLSEKTAEGYFYPNAKEYLTTLKKNLEELGAENIKFFICIRPYPDFFSSVYCEYLRHNKFLDFHQYISSECLGRYSWIFLIKDISEIVGKENIHIWEFEDFFTHREKITSTLFGQNSEVTLDWDARDWKKIRRSRFSQKAIDVLHQINEVYAYSRKESGRLSYYIDLAFPKSEELPVFQPFSEHELVKLSKRYYEDVRELKRKYQFVV